MTERSRSLFDDKVALIFWCSPGIALLIWDFVSGHGTARLLLNCYILVTTPFFVLRGAYPPVGSRWFWTSMIPICALIGVAIYGYLHIASWLAYESVNLPARMALGITGSVAVLEGICACRIVDATEPKLDS